MSVGFPTSRNERAKPLKINSEHSDTDSDSRYFIVSLKSVRGLQNFSTCPRSHCTVYADNSMVSVFILAPALQ